VSACALVSVLTTEGKLAYAQKLHTLSIDVYRRHLGEASLGYAGCLQRGAEVELALGGPHLDRAADIYTQLRSNWAPKPGSVPEIYAIATIGLARTELARGRLEAAQTEAADLMGLIAASPEREFVPDREAQAARVLGVSWTRLGHPDQGETWLRHAIELREQLDYSDSVWLAEAQIDLATALVAQSRLDEARDLLHRAADAQRRQPQLAASFRMELADGERLLQRAEHSSSGPQR
jgi:tetratricopeptide (TPR) repeat protein